MLKICALLQDPSTVNVLRDFTRVVRDELIAEDKNPTLINVYNKLQEKGVDIDIQTAGKIYKEIFPTSDTGYTSAADVDSMAGHTVDTIINYTAPTPSTQQLKGDSPEVKVFKAVFNQLKVPGGQRLQSTLKQMEDRLRKWALDQLQLKGKKSEAKTAEQVLAQLFHLTYQQSMNVGGVQAVLQNMETLQTQMLTELNDLLQSIDTDTADYDSQLIEDTINKVASVPVRLAYTSSEFKLIMKEGLLNYAPEFGKDYNSQTGTKRIVDWNNVARSGVPFSSIVAKSFPQFSAQEQQMMTDAMTDEYDRFINAKKEDILKRKNLIAKTPRTTKERSAMDRLYELYDLGIFQAAEQDALLPILGIADYDATLIRDMEDFARKTRAAHDVKIEKWVPSFNTALQLVVDLMLERAEERGSKGIRAARVASYIMQMNTAFLILNPQNIMENTSSGLTHLFFTMIHNPNGVKPAVKTFFNIFKDTVQGGVRVGEDFSNVYDTRGDVAKRFTLKVGNRSWQGKAMQGMTTLTQASIQSFDNGFKGSISTLLLSNGIAKMLRKNNPNLAKGEEYIIANEALYKNTQEAANFADQEARRLRSVGYKAGIAEKKRWMAEYSLSNLVAGGNVFSDIIDQLVRERKITSKGVEGISEDMLLMLRTAANSTAGKALGHEPDIALLKWTTDWNKSAAARMAAAKKSRDKNEIIKATVANIVQHTITKFIGSSYRWLWLTASRTTPIPGLALAAWDTGLVITDRVKTGSFKNARGFGRMNFKNLDFDSVLDHKKQEDMLKQHMAIRERYGRMIAGNILSYTVGYHVILPMLLKAYAALFDDDDELTTEEKLAKVSVWIQEDRSRRKWFAKMLPMVAYDYMMRITHTDQTTGFRPKARENPEAMTGMDFLSPSVVGGMALRQAGEISIWRDLARLQSEQQKTTPRTRDIFIESLFNMVNLGGAPKAVNNTLEAFGLGETGKQTDWQRKALKPDNALEATVRGNIGVALYANVFNKDVTEIAPVDPYIISLYQATGDLDLLPAVPQVSLEYQNWEMQFTPEMSTEWIDLNKEWYRTMSSYVVPTLKSTMESNQTNKEKKEFMVYALKAAYTQAREAAKGMFMVKYPITEFGVKKD